MEDDERMPVGEHVNILALDIATRTGYCYGKGDNLKFGHYIIPKKYDYDGIKFFHFSVWVQEMIRRHKPEAIAIEKPFVRGYSTFYLFGLCAVAEAIAASFDVPIVKVTPNTIKKSFTGSGKASKLDMLNRALEKGYNVTVDDEADAIALHQYVQTQIHFDLDKEE